VRQRQTKGQKEGDRIEDYLTVDPIELEIGYGLIPLVDAEHDGDLLKRITLIRKQQALALGIVIPPIRIRDNIQLKPQQYRLKIRGNEVAGGELLMGRWLALNPGSARGKVPGVATKEPTYGLPALWISADDKLRAQEAGYTVVEPAAVLATHLVEILKSSAHKILSREATKTLIDNFKKTNATVVEELIPNALTYGAVHKVLQKLLREGIPVRDLATILETLADYSGLTKDTDLLTEYVRYALSATITHKFRDPDGRIYALTLDPTLEKLLHEEFGKRQTGAGLSGLPALAPALLQGFYADLTRRVQEMQSQGRLPVLVCSPLLRATLRRLTEPILPHLSVISYGELLVNAEVESVGLVAVERAAA
jgi:flagellar biosynthesis protein FlhA